MRYTIRLLAAVIAAAPLSAQTPALTGRYTAMREVLKDLVTRQERYYAGHGTYTTDQLALGVPMPKTHADAVKQGFSLAIVQAGGRGWWAQGQLSGPDAKGCAIYVGEMKYFGVAPTTPGGTQVGGDEGRIACDAP